MIRELIACLAAVAVWAVAVFVRVELAAWPAAHGAGSPARGCSATRRLDADHPGFAGLRIRWGRVMGCGT